MTRIGIIGPGQAGTGLGVALHRAGHRVWLHGRRRKAIPPPLSASWQGAPPWLDQVEVVILAVPDHAIETVARDLAGLGRVGSSHVVLHLSGLLDTAPLEPLRGSGAALGVLHPMQSLARPEAAPLLLAGALAGITGTDERAIAVATGLASSVGLVPVRLDAAAKARYHAAAVVASNYLVVLAETAERLLCDAGLPPETARSGLTALMRGTLDNVAEGGAASALSGPVRRGDADTIRRHLDSLPPGPRELYRALARAALELADLPADQRARVERALAP